MKNIIIAFLLCTLFFLIWDDYGIRQIKKSFYESTMHYRGLYYDLKDKK